MDKSEIKIFSSLCEIIEESETISLEVMNHLDVVLEKLDNLKESKDLQSDIDSIINNITITMSSMQAQDSHRQKIERVANLIHPENTKFAKAKHITAEECAEFLCEDELEALVGRYT